MHISAVHQGALVLLAHMGRLRIEPAVGDYPVNVGIGVVVTGVDDGDEGLDGSDDIPVLPGKGTLDVV